MNEPELLTPLGFRRACGQFPTGVTVVTSTTRSGETRGMTLSAFMSLSIDPYLIVVSVANNTHLSKALNESDRYAVSILREDQQSVSNFFAGSADALSKPPFSFVVPDSPPVVEGAIAWMQCGISAAIPAGDHTLWLGAPSAIWAEPTNNRRPLVYSQSAYQVLKPDGAEPVDWPVDYVAVARLP
jgi:flavin reductase (DIM6/NTAB) family NADH-FMN oxidoreductase RutF